jgi:hypothetical protein
MAIISIAIIPTSPIWSIYAAISRGLCERTGQEEQQDVCHRVFIELLSLFFKNWASPLPNKPPIAPKMMAMIGVKSK